MLVTESGMVIDDRLVQDRNAPCPTLVTEFGMVTCPDALGAKRHAQLDGCTQPSSNTKSVRRRMVVVEYRRPEKCVDRTKSE